MDAFIEKDYYIKIKENLQNHAPGGQMNAKTGFSCLSLDTCKKCFC